MPSLKAIRRRITSVKSTQKITRAMKLVAAARLRKAQQAIMELRPYARKTGEVLASVAARGVDGEGIGELTNARLLQSRPVKLGVLVVFTSDRGLAGAFNSNVQRMAERRIRELEAEGVADVKVVTIGRKGRDYFRRRGVEVLHDFTGAYAGGNKRAAEIARQLIDDYLEDKVDRVELVYSEFKSAMTQRPTVEQILPVRPGGPADDEAPEGAAPTAPGARDAAGATTGDFIYEPDRGALLDRLLPMYVEVAVFRAMLESVASEHGARMTAMDNATRNAKEMIGSLTLQYNRARQAAITKELMEIIGGAEALKG